MIYGASDYNASFPGSDRVHVVLLVYRYAPRLPPVLIATCSMRERFLAVRVRSIHDLRLVVARTRKLTRFIGSFPIHRGVSCGFVWVEVFRALPWVKVLSNGILVVCLPSL